MNLRSLCLIFALAALPLAVPAQPSKPDTPTKPAPANPAATMQIKQEFSGEFQYAFVNKEKSSPPATLPAPSNGIVVVPIATGYKDGTLEIQDLTRGDIARLPVKTDGLTSLNENSFKWARVVTIPVKSGGNPVTGVSVALASKDGSFKGQHTLDAADAGIARFNNVPLNQPLTVTVSFGANPEISQSNTITRGHAPDGFAWSPIELNWKDVKTLAAPAVPANSSTNPAPTAGTTGAPPVLPQTAPSEAATGGGGLGGILNTLISLGLLAGIAYGLYWAYQQGKIKTLLEKLGINTATLTTPDAGAVASNPFQKNTAPVTQISEGTADPFANGGVVGATTPAPVGSGLRLVATMGTYAGQIYPLAGGTVEIGRDAANGIPLPNDTNASRRHATLQLNGGQIMVTDNGSSNGTFINGVRIATQTPTQLNPRDELTVGNTRFRFEA